MARHTRKRKTINNAHNTLNNSNVSPNEIKQQRLTDLKLEYDLLSNELFHLKEFISLAEFNPLFENESENFKRFIKDNNLDLNSLNIDRLDEKDSKQIENSDQKPIRRNLRASSTRSLLQENSKKDLTEDSDWLREIAPLVKKRYAQLNLNLKKNNLHFNINHISKSDNNLNNLLQLNNNEVNEKNVNRKLFEKTENIDKEQKINILENGISNGHEKTQENQKSEQIEQTEEIEEKESSNSPDNNEFRLVAKPYSAKNIIDDYDFDYYFTSSSSEDDNSDYEPPVKRPKIKLFVNPPKQTITNPMNIVHPQFDNFHEYLQSYKSLDEDITLDEYNKYINEQKKVVAGIRKGLRSGALKYDRETDSLQPITTKDARQIQYNRPEPISFLYKEQNLQTYPDYLLNQGVHLSKLFQSNVRAKISRARRVSQMIEQHFKHIAGADERKLREAEKHRRLLARNAMLAVKKRWNLAEKAYRVLKKDEEEELKKIEGKEHLSRMLEQSTQLLDAQLSKRHDRAFTITSTANTDADDDSDDSDGSDENNWGSTQNSDNEELNEGLSNDDNITSSDEDFDKRNNKSDDEELTVEELKEKYSKLHSDKNINKNQDNGTENESMLKLTAVESSLPEVSDSETDVSITTEDSDSDDSDDSEEVADQANIGLGALLSKNEVETDSDDNEEWTINNNNVDEDAYTVTDGDVLKPGKIENRTTPKSRPDGETTSSELGKDASFIETVDTVSNSKNTTEDIDNTIDNTSSTENEENQIQKSNINERSEDLQGLDKETDPLTVEDVPIPSLLRGTLRIYQKQGLNWLASLYNNNTNGILADEMGLGKTIQTISLLAYLACEKENWGPHLIVVPTSVLLNWEMEFKKFAPGFKVLTYYGSPQQRKEKRKGWNKPDAFHVCIVSYQLVVQDQHSFKRKKWEYMILDEAHNIKNFRSTRWQALLNFNTRRRLLLTGTPLQNNIAELWSLLYFLMPQTVSNGENISGFANLEAFQQWFGRPVDKIIETSSGADTLGNGEYDSETTKTISKLHQVLRPYLLRRLKADVEKQMPGKYEHIVYCRLSKRQRYLYDDFMSRTKTKETLASGNFMSIVNCLMQLRKVCNHPDLFEVRPVLSSFCVEESIVGNYNDTEQLIQRFLGDDNKNIELNFQITNNCNQVMDYHLESIRTNQCNNEFDKSIAELKETFEESKIILSKANEFFNRFGYQKYLRQIKKLKFLKYLNQLKCDRTVIYSKNLINMINIDKALPIDNNLIKPLKTRIIENKGIISNYAVITPKVVTLDIRKISLGVNDESKMKDFNKEKLIKSLRTMENPLDQLQTKLTIAFPDKSLLQYDCGKLQQLYKLLQKLSDEGHRALIFTQMTKVLDILEQFLNYHGYLYMRLDGATKIEDRQILTERFNNDSRVTVFILSSRSGGLGINLTGADTVIFYDSDWNPAMDKQCQDRCHRIGQTRDVHIYRFVSDHTIESNILKKANQKRELDNVIIQKGEFTTDYFTKLSVRELLGNEATQGIVNDDKPILQEDKGERDVEKLLAQAEDEADVKAANLAMKEYDDIDQEDFVDEQPVVKEDEYEGTNHVEEYMLRYIANGYA
ncbi:hypothetical protein TBLA_0A03310 [Henningerozyma blattae CBS 6284]|uniref:Helicase SWR1 n=1 Tax=Henningerozyma blattae (strain ATCC 34711 / CBS 6284 / DSM 70876 / NBRC 10599 / NRRL Y-10934 / UCD 77-7) TaxID=1071380 RepID=I2GVH9_HENB6|nr:hypothetical protein TBLA_0A03310 [Tetrapisispora blattae CBS 6284]CCH58131.1 hypothetical protein TBLA_0A03310 [Tetrapisispora blattae CBS 6284]